MAISRKLLAITTTALTVLSAVPAMAQDADEGASFAGDIIVTARRVEERLQDVPISMTVLDQSQLANRNITVANDLATYTPSLSSNERYGPEKQSFSLRGFNQDQSTAPTVGVYFAEVVGVRAQGGTTSGNSVGAGAFMDLQNVQVLKGPQGTLQGRNTTGGAIMLTPTKPTDKFEGYLEGSMGNYDMWRLQGAVNIPLADTFKVRFAADRMQRNGYMKNVAANASVKDFNDRNYQAYRLSIVANLTPDLENYTIASYSKSNTNGYSARITNCATPATGLNIVPGSAGYSGTRHITALSCGEQLARQNARGDDLYTVETSIKNPFLRLEQWQVVNTTTWTASDSLTLKNIVSYGEFREQTHFDLYPSNFTVPTGGFNPSVINPQIPSFVIPAGTPYQYIQLDLDNPRGYNSAQSTFTEELQLQGNIGEKFNFVLGGYFEASRPIGNSSGRTGIYLNCTRPQDLTCTNPLAFGSISESRTQLSFDNNGIFGQGTYKFSDQLSLTAGLRYTMDKISGHTTSTRASLITNPLDPRPSFIDPTTGVRLARQCTDSFRLGNGYVVGGDVTKCRTDLVNKSNKPTWVIDLDYKITPDMMAYIKWARGYRQGGLNFTNPGLETWGPESMDTFEGGLKTSFRGAVNGYFNLAAFYNKLRDMQLFGGLTASSAYPGVAGGAAIINAGGARSYGLEADGSLSFFDNSLRLDLGYAYLNTKITKIASQAELDALLVGTPFSKLTPTATLGSPFTLSPKHKVTVTGTYTLPLPESIGKLSIAGTVTHTSTQIANGSVPAILGPVGGGVLPKRTLVNLNLNWSEVGGLPVDLALFATNVTKKVYAVNTGGGWNSSGVGDMLMGEPRMFGARVKVKFGN